jgi:uncharacterized protein (UPF0147 family)
MYGKAAEAEGFLAENPPTPPEEGKRRRPSLAEWMVSKAAQNTEQELTQRFEEEQDPSVKAAILDAIRQVRGEQPQQYGMTEGGAVPRTGEQQFAQSQQSQMEQSAFEQRAGHAALGTLSGVAPALGGLAGRTGQVFGVPGAEQLLAASSRGQAEAQKTFQHVPGAAGFTGRLAGSAGLAIPALASAPVGLGLMGAQAAGSVLLDVNERRMKGEDVSVGAEFGTAFAHGVIEAGTEGIGLHAIKAAGKVLKEAAPALAKAVEEGGMEGVKGTAMELLRRAGMLASPAAEGAFEEVIANVAQNIASNLIEPTNVGQGSLEAAASGALLPIALSPVSASQKRGDKKAKSEKAATDNAKVLQELIEDESIPDDMKQLVADAIQEKVDEGGEPDIPALVKAARSLAGMETAEATDTELSAEEASELEAEQAEPTESDFEPDPDDQVVSSEEFQAEQEAQGAVPKITERPTPVQIAITAAQRGDPSVREAQPQNETEQAVSQFLKDRGIGHAFITGEKIRGGEHGGVVLIKTGDEANAVWEAVTHEVTHASGLQDVDFVGGLGKKLGKKYDKQAIDAAAAAGLKDRAAELRRDPVARRREANAQFVGEILRNPTRRARLQAENPTMFQKAMDFIQQAFDSLRGRAATVDQIIDAFTTGVASPQAAPKPVTTQDVEASRARVEKAMEAQEEVGKRGADRAAALKEADRRIRQFDQRRTEEAEPRPRASERREAERREEPPPREEMGPVEKSVKATLRAEAPAAPPSKPAAPPSKPAETLSKPEPEMRPRVSEAEEKALARKREAKAAKPRTQEVRMGSAEAQQFFDDVVANRGGHAAKLKEIRANQDALIPLAQKGDVDAELMLMAIHIPAIKAHAGKLAHGRDIVNDLVAEGQAAMLQWMHGKTRRPAKKPTETVSAHQERVNAWVASGGKQATQLARWPGGKDIWSGRGGMSSPVRSRMEKLIERVIKAPQVAATPEAIETTAAETADHSLGQETATQKVESEGRPAEWFKDEKKRNQVNSMIETATRLQKSGKDPAEIADMMGIGEDIVAGLLASPKFLPANATPRERADYARNTFKAFDVARDKGKFVARPENRFMLAESDRGSVEEQRFDSYEQAWYEAKRLESKWNPDIPAQVRELLATERMLKDKREMAEISAAASKEVARRMRRAGVTDMAPPKASGKRRQAYDLTDSILNARKAVEQFYDQPKMSFLPAKPTGKQMSDAQKKLIDILAENPKVTGDPRLANPQNVELRRRFQDLVDQVRKDAKLPTKETFGEWERDGKKMAADPKERQRIVDQMESGTPQSSGAEVAAGKEILNDVTSRWFKNFNSADFTTAFEYAWGWRSGRAETARVLAAGADRIKKPGQRLAEFVKNSVMTPPPKVAKVYEAAKDIGDIAGKDAAIDKWRKSVEEMFERWKLAGIDPSKLDQEILDNPEQKYQIIRDIQTLHEANGGWAPVQEFYRNMLMFAPVTIVRNALGGFWAMADLTLYKPMARTFEKLHKETSGESQAAILHSLGSKTVWAKAMFHLKASYMNEIPTFDTDVGETTGIEELEIHRPPAITGEGTEANISKLFGARAGKISGGLVKWSGKWLVREPQRLNSAIDQAVKVIHAHSEVAAHAVRIGRDQIKLKPGSPAMRAFVEGQLDNLESRSWAVAIASGETQRVTFQLRAKPDSVEATLIKYRNKVPMLGLLLPFIKTPVQIAKEAYVASAFGITTAPRTALETTEAIRAARKAERAFRAHPKDKRIKAVAQRARGVADMHAQRAAVLAAKQTMAWLAFASIWQLLGDDDDEPWITGPASYAAKDRSERQTRAQVEHPMSIRIGSEWYPYKNIEPFSTILGVTVTAAQELKAAVRGRRKPGEAALRSFKRIGGLFSDQTYLRTIGDIVKMAQDPEIYGVRALETVSSAWTPNFIDSYLRAADPKVRERRVTGEPGERPTFVDRVSRDMFPTKSLVPPPKVNFFGDDVEHPFGPSSGATIARMLGVQPRATVTGKRKQVISMLINYNDKQINPKDRVWLQQPGISVDVKIPGKIAPARQQMTAMQYYLSSKLAGQIADEAIKDREWPYKNPTERDVLELKKIFSAGKTQGRRYITAARNYAASGDHIEAERVMDALRKEVEERGKR